MPVEPTLHKPIPFGTRVRSIQFPQFVGEVAGTSFCHVTWSYIVILDEPIVNDPVLGKHGTIKAISLMGTDLEAEDGSMNWKVDPCEF